MAFAGRANLHMLMHVDSRPPPRAASALDQEALPLAASE
jgi:hypothetical protein